MKRLKYDIKVRKLYLRKNASRNAPSSRVCAAEARVDSFRAGGKTGEHARVSCWGKLQRKEMRFKIQFKLMKWKRKQKVEAAFKFDLLQALNN